MLAFCWTHVSVQRKISVCFGVPYVFLVDGRYRIYGRYPIPISEITWPPEFVSREGSQSGVTLSAVKTIKLTNVARHHVEAAAPSEAAAQSVIQFKPAVLNAIVNMSTVHGDCVSPARATPRCRRRTLQKVSAITDTAHTG
jgi:hypothetical protein